MILPPCPRSLNLAAAAWMPQSTPSTLTAQIFATSSGVTSAIGFTWAMPALLIITSNPSSADSACSTAA